MTPISLTAATPLTLRLPAYERVYLLLAGCGGTGSHIATGLAAIALALAERGRACAIDLVDPDRVERKNIGRQLFGEADLRQPKAFVLRERLQAAYGLPVGAIHGRFSAQLARPQPGTLTVVVGAVDNPAARAEIAKAVTAGGGRVWALDCGNENHSGQVAVGNSAARITPALGLTDALPSPYTVYPDLVAAPRQAKRKAASCAELTEAGTQGLMVNRMAAAWALSLLNDLLLGTLRVFAVDFDLSWAGVRARTIDAEALKPWTKGKR